MKKIVIICLVLLVVGAILIVADDYKKEDIISVINNITREEITSEEVAKGNKVTDASSGTQQGEDTIKTEKMYAVWLTYSEIGSLVKGKTENEYKESIDIVFENLKANKINTVFYQCRAFCDSFYSSEIFPG